MAESSVSEPEKKPRSRTRKRKSSPEKKLARGPAQEVLKTMKRLTHALEGSDTEIFRIAALHVIHSKLDEVIQLLRVVAPEGQTLSQSAAPLESKPLRTFDNVDRLIAQTDQAAMARATGPPCQLCGRPSVYKTKRGMTLCEGHAAQGIKDDQDDKVQELMSRGFGRAGQSEDVIRVESGALSGDGAEG